MIGTGGGAAKTGGLFQLGSAGLVTKLTAYIRGYGYAKAAIYSDLNGHPMFQLAGPLYKLLFPQMLVGLILYILRLFRCKQVVIG
jgi:hypothetical protein